MGEARGGRGGGAPPPALGLRPLQQRIGHGDELVAAEVAQDDHRDAPILVTQPQLRRAVACRCVHHDVGLGPFEEPARELHGLIAEVGPRVSQRAPSATATSLGRRRTWSTQVL